MVQVGSWGSGQGTGGWGPPEPCRQGQLASPGGDSGGDEVM